MGLIQRPQPQGQAKPIPTAKPVATHVATPQAKPVATPPPVAKSPIAQQTVIQQGVNRVLGNPQPVTPIPQPQSKDVFPDTPSEGIEDLTQVENPISQLLTSSSNFEPFPEFTLDEFVDVGCIAYTIADLLPNPRFAKNNDPQPSIKFLFSDGEIRKWTRWFSLMTDAKSNLNKFWSPRIPEWQTVTQDENLFNLGFQIRIARDPNPKYTKYDAIQLGDADVSKVFYDIEYMPLQYTKAYGKIVPVKLAVLKTKDGIVRLRHEQLKNNNVYEAEKAARRQQNAQHQEYSTEEATV